MTQRTIPDDVIQAQQTASDPGVSAWVSANAGAGKTHVLAQRVIRLLLDGTDPAKILCLTFTKAAAANMANRIFETLGKWIAFDDATLDKAIRSTGAKPGGRKQHEQARRLFASALETPGGLKVQTIHSFCTRLLQQFPFEANVAARFRVLEQVEQQQMLESIRRDVLLEAANNPEGALGRALATIIPMAGDYAIQEGLTEALRERGAIASWLRDPGGLEQAHAQLSSALGIEPDDTLAQVEAEIVDGPHLPPGEWTSAASICDGGSKNDKTQARRLRDAAAAAGASRIAIYLTIFLSQSNGPRQSIITSALAKQNRELEKRLNDEKNRIVALCERRKALMVRDRTIALLGIAQEMIRRYEIAKDRRGLLDYDDLIARTRNLLHSRGNVTWVHYKLDQGIDHLLIDEAQDTSPEQWDIIKSFAAEFGAGAGARGPTKRSIFAVGDDKQSIFSFQGAEPAAFEDNRRHFENMLVGSGRELKPVPLNYSFRSVPTVLEAVDAVFRQPAAHKGLTVDPVPTVHEAVRANAPGLVELWPPVVPDNKQKGAEWDAPFDVSSETSPRVQLARQIAATVKCWLRRGDLVGDEPHPVRAGDILILVRQRGPLFEAIIRQLKNADIAVAGADRLVLTEHIAVLDLLALADALLLQEDDLALAAVLKSPLFGLSEQELFELAYDRKASLRTTLRTRRPELGARLDALSERAKTLTPFAFYAELLGRERGRRAILARLGAEANDALDEFLNLALAYEQRQTPSLQGFVAWLRTASAEVKRDLEIARNEVRVMTVHGAKGLEAPIVILADTTTEPAGPNMLRPKLHRLPASDAYSECIAWMPNRSEETPALQAARLTMTEAAENEYRRLLYVAMTRAADRLIVCGATGERGMPAGCWYQLIRDGLTESGRLAEERADVGEGVVYRFRRSADAAMGQASPAAADAAEPALPDWLTRKVAPTPRDAAAMSPSKTLDDKALPAAAAAARVRARERGIAMHRLMQSLPDIPPERRAEAAQRYLSRLKTFTDAERDAMAGRVFAALKDARFGALFEPGSRAEVPVVGRLGTRMVSGVIDRLVVTPEAVLIADYKTNRPPPRSLAEAKTRHPGYIRQLALYRALLTPLYPDRSVEAVLVWTETPELMEIPAAELDAAMRELTAA